MSINNTHFYSDEIKYSSQSINCHTPLKSNNKKSIQTVTPQKIDISDKGNIKDYIEKIATQSEKIPIYNTPLKRNNKNKITINTPRKLGIKDKKVIGIYCFNNTKSNQCYFGKSTHIGNRLSQWIYGANNEKSDIGKSLLATEIRKNPEDFDITILPISNATDLNRYESTLIDDAKQNGVFNLNQRRGGGGGTSSSDASDSDVEDTDIRCADSRSSSIQIKYETPKKRYQLSSIKSGFAITPTSKTKSRIIYQIAIEGTKFRYYGKTTRKFLQRMSCHVSYCKKPEAYHDRLVLTTIVHLALNDPIDHKSILNPKQAALINSLLPNLKDATGVTASILKEVPPNESLEEYERAYIREARKQGLVLINLNEGGGGPGADL